MNVWLIMWIVMHVVDDWLQLECGCNLWYVFSIVYSMSGVVFVFYCCRIMYNQNGVVSHC